MAKLIINISSFIKIHNLHTFLRKNNLFSRPKFHRNHSVFDVLQQISMLERQELF